MFSAVVGLGNPGPRYRHTRHNIGCTVVQALAEHESVTAWKSKFHGSWATVSRPPMQLRLLVPANFMNKAGESVRPFAEFFSLSPADILIVHDDLELPFGEVALREGGGLGGHNGLRSVAQHLGTRDFPRLRIGIGRPARGDVASYVLARFTPQEEAELVDVVETAVATILRST
ncbi:aminoacyl-tRNA hydrolase [Spirochaeta africana]|uniref:Peptidyl-tRNA hydrolase n=1 Tax=Spirochaeta africana (strain ATCC 700263 / DSM 8902 / Z-7692) TaxID=889378 RepID=H9UMZ0_SPIAZ|nr:aminoacyl-tRNA hydrolase [Spirochaeta africana]AFG38883.1 peptidyl-tRNA hydrolase [Spirochaeta africana DSM 8902]